MVGMMTLMITQLLRLAQHVNHEVLQATSVINSYIDGVNDPIACKLEAILSSFRYQMCLEESHSMSSTYLTDYFGRR